MGKVLTEGEVVAFLEAEGFVDLPHGSDEFGAGLGLRVYSLWFGGNWLRRRHFR